MPTKWLIIFVLFPAIGLFARDGQPIPLYKAIYLRADSLYSLDQPTTVTDSLARQNFDRVISLLAKDHIDDSVLADCYVRSGILEMTAGRRRQAIIRFLSAKIPDAKDEAPRANLVFRAMVYAGSCYYELFDVDSAAFYYRLAEDLQQRYPPFEDQERLYNKMGVLYYETGDYTRSIPYFRKALAIVTGRPHPEPFLVINYQNNIGTALLKLGDYQQAISIFKSLLPMKRYRQELLYNIGSACLDAGDPIQALSWLRLAAWHTRAGYNMLARTWLQLKKPDSAAFYLRPGATVRSETIAQHLADEAIRLKLLGDWYKTKSETAKALAAYQQGILLLTRDFKDTSIRKNPATFWAVRQPYALFDLITEKAATLRDCGTSTKDTALLGQAFAAYRSAIGLARHVQRTYLSDQARLFLAGRAEQVYRDAIDLAFRLFALTNDNNLPRMAFSLAESSKASVLQVRLGDPDPPALAEPARALVRTANAKKAEGAVLQSQLASVRDSSHMEQLQQQLRDLELSISTIQDRLDQLPDYRSRKYAGASPDIATLQQALPDNATTLLSYYYTPGKLYLFYLTKQRFGCAVTAWDPVTAKQALELHRLLNTGSGDRQAVTAIVDRLSTTLVTPISTEIDAAKRLVIIPCHELLYLPFELLHSSADKRPLLYRHAVSYAYSANLVAQSPVPIQSVYKVLAFAPFTHEKGGWPALPASESEITGLPGEVLAGTAASRQRFIAEAGDYPILHLATHAVADGADASKSYVAFAPDPAADTIGRLYEPAIRQLDLRHADLVLLSACRSGDGPLVHSEGVISLSRAFTYAGARSVITSLWKADDPATAYIVRHTHHYLQKGLPKDLALQKAKLDYLEDGSIPSVRKNPAFWAHLVLVGDTSPIIANERNWFLPITAALAISIVLWIIYKKTGRGKPRPVRQQALRDEG